MRSPAFDNYEYAHNRLDALYMQVFEEEINFTDSIVELMQELFVTHLVAMAEAYQTELTRELLAHRVTLLVSGRKAKNKMVRILTGPNVSSWSDALDEIVETGTRIVTDDHNLETWLTSWLPNNRVGGNGLDGRSPSSAGNSRLSKYLRSSPGNHHEILHKQYDRVLYVDRGICTLNGH